MTSKSYTFQDKYDFIYYLGFLIVEVINNLKKLECYCIELGNVIQDNTNEKYIESTQYYNLWDKTILTLCDLFNFIGDKTSNAMSYWNFRKHIKSKKDIFEINLGNLNQDTECILDEYYSFRNWKLHLPESMANSFRENLNLNSNNIRKIMNPLKVLTFKYYEMEYLKRLEQDCREVINDVKRILNCMKDDYSLLIGEELNILEEVIEYKPFAFTNIYKMSYDIQMESHNKRYNQKEGKQ